MGIQANTLDTIPIHPACSYVAARLPYYTLFSFPISPHITLPAQGVCEVISLHCKSAPTDDNKLFNLLKKITTFTLSLGFFSNSKSFKVHTLPCWWNTTQRRRCWTQARSNVPCTACCPRVTPRGTHHELTIDFTWSLNPVGYLKKKMNLKKIIKKLNF